MKGLLIRVGADLSDGGGSWNGPVDGRSGEFAYVAIPENGPIRPGLAKPYTAVVPVLNRFGFRLPAHLSSRTMHLDPDFYYLKYGDGNERANQIRANLQPGDFAVVYSALRDIHPRPSLVYAIIGFFEVECLVDAAAVPEMEWDINAHSRRAIAAGARDVIIKGRQGKSGRLARCIPIGEYRDRAYRVRRDVLNEWGGLSVHDGYLQRSARLPRFLEPRRFMEWFEGHHPVLVQSNN